MSRVSCLAQMPQQPLVDTTSLSIPSQASGSLGPAPSALCGLGCPGSRAETGFASELLLFPAKGEVHLPSRCPLAKVGTVPLGSRRSCLSRMSQGAKGCTSGYCSLAFGLYAPYVCMRAMA